MYRPSTEVSARLWRFGSCLLLTALLLGGFSLGKNRYKDVPEASSRVLLKSADGTPLASAFGDLHPTLKLGLWKRSLARNTVVSRKCKNNIFTRAERKAVHFLGLDATVYAQDCNGCYNTVQPATCGGSCGEDPIAESDPENPTGGVYFAGDYACIDCGEMLPLYAGCTNPYC